MVHYDFHQWHSSLLMCMFPTNMLSDPYNVKMQVMLEVILILANLQLLQQESSYKLLQLELIFTNQMAIYKNNFVNPIIQPFKKNDVVNHFCIFAYPKDFSYLTLLNGKLLIILVLFQYIYTCMYQNNQQTFQLIKVISVQCQQSYEISQPLALTFDELSKILYVTDEESNIIKYEYNNKSLSIQTTYKVGQQIQNTSQILSFHIQWKIIHQLLFIDMELQLKVMQQLLDSLNVDYWWQYEIQIKNNQ